MDRMQLRRPRIEDANHSPASSRRALLKYVGASALVAGSAALKACAPELSDEELDERIKALLDEAQRRPNSNYIPPNGPLDVAGMFDLRAAAKRNIPIAHFEYLEAAAGGGATARANEAAFAHYSMRSRRMHGIDEPDLSINILGERWPSPIALAPVGSQRAFHPEGEAATALGAKQTGAAMMLSSLSTTSFEDVTKVLGSAPWFQLYVLNSEMYRKAVLDRAARDGAEVVVVTVDDIGGRGAENYIMGQRADTRDCSQCHDSPRTVAGHARRKPMLSAFADEPGFDLGAVNMNWDFLKALRDIVPGKLIVKGILDPQDAQRCVAIGADGIIVSNHGGRVNPNGESALAALPDIASAVGGRTTLLMDSGIRRGSDVFTALALGADAVCVGRPYVWGLGAYGAGGVARVMELLNDELRRCMIQAGTARIDDIVGRSVRRRFT